MEAEDYLGLTSKKNNAQSEMSVTDEKETFTITIFRFCIAFCFSLLIDLIDGGQTELKNQHSVVCGAPHAIPSGQMLCSSSSSTCKVFKSLKGDGGQSVPLRGLLLVLVSAVTVSVVVVIVVRA